MISMGPLVDTSVLVDYFTGENTLGSDLLDQFLGSGPPPVSLFRSFCKGSPIHGITGWRAQIWHTLDTLIVTLAWHHDCDLLTRDRRQMDLASFLGVRLTV